MNPRSLALGVIAIAVFATSPVHAQRRTMFITVEELSKDCMGEREICVGFITGVADALEATAWPNKRSCRGNDVQLKEVLELAMELLAEPLVNKADGPAFDYLADAYVEKWPC